MPAALLGQKQPEVKEENLDYAAAYLILIGKDGSYTLETNINKPVTVDRVPTSHEIKGSLAVVLSDIASQEAGFLASQFMQMSMAAQAQRMQEAMANAKALEGVRL